MKYFVIRMSCKAKMAMMKIADRLNAEISFGEEYEVCGEMYCLCECTNKEKGRALQDAYNIEVRKLHEVEV